MSSVKHGGDILLTFTISIGTNYWDRLDVLTTERFDFPLVTDSVFRFSQIIIKLSALQEFESKLTQWIGSQPFELESEFAGVSDAQSFHFLLHDFRGTRTLPDYQVFLSYAAAKASTRICIEVDETCITVLKDSLDEFLRTMRIEER